ncbi:LVIVD repeat-containing protein [Flavitalea antarctica]
MLKTYIPLRTLFSLVFFIFLLSSCMKDKLTKTYTIYSPVYKTKQEVLASVKFAEPQTISSPGKIYILGKYIFLNELNKGVHVIDNANASSPKVIGFINIPGNVDIAVKGNILYADMYADLLTIDISDPTKTKLLKTLPKLFPERFYGLGYTTDTSKIIVDWIRKDTTVDIDDQMNYGGCPNCMYASASASADKSSSASPAGIGGSMARFTIVNNHMYTVGESDLSVLSISNTVDPVLVGTQKIGMNIETIYPFKNKLFIGSSAGMFIYSINDPSKPSRESSFSHARACDPVIADDNYAYVTLRTGTWCAGTTNTLDVIDIANISAPRLVKTYQLKNPHGLSKDGDLLFICDGSDGLKLYNAANVNDLKLLDHVKDLETYDVIAWNKLLMVVSRTGLHQYDYSDGKTMRLLSTLQINKKP